MESKDIVLFAVAFSVLGISLYRKYMKKNQAGKPDQKPSNTGSSFSSIKDDYEPYSKKQTTSYSSKSGSEKDL